MKKVIRTKQDKVWLDICEKFNVDPKGEFTIYRDRTRARFPNIILSELFEAGTFLLENFEEKV